MKKLLLSTYLIFALVICKAQWIELGTGANALNSTTYITALAVDDYGTIYAGAGFYNGGTVKFNVAKWNGTIWAQLGTGANALNANNEVAVITTDKAGNVYAAGGFTDSSGYNYVAKWDGIRWSELGVGSNALAVKYGILSIAVDKLGNVYAGVSIKVDSSYIAKWNGATWSKLGSLTSEAYVDIWSVAVDDSGNVYAVGDFTDGSNQYSVAKWNGTVWSELAPDSNILYASPGITLDNKGNPYVAFKYTDSTEYYISKWNGTSWSLPAAENAGLNTTAINSIAVDSVGNAYAAVGGGVYTSAREAAEQSVNTNMYVAKWDGTSWSNLGTAGDSANGISLIVADKLGNVYGAGSFTDSNGYYYVAKYSPLAVTGTINATVTSTLTVYPNPGNGNFTVDLPEAAQVSVYGALGDLIVTQNLPKGKQLLNLTNKPAGVYYLKTNSNNGQQAVKLVVE